MSRFVKRGEFRSDTTRGFTTMPQVASRQDTIEKRFNKTLPTLIIKIFDCVFILNIYSKSGKGSMNYYIIVLSVP